MQMDTVRLQGQDRVTDVVLGPCPGCQNWQLDYTDAVATELADQRIPTGPIPDAHPFLEILEELLQEHLEECPHLQRLLEF